MHRADVGDKNVLEIMRKQICNFGGEQSGHIIMSDYAKTGDGLATALQVLAYLISSQKKASEILRPFSLHPQLQENLKIVNKIPLDKISGLSKLINEIEKKNIRQLIRYSGTENLLRILVEGKDEVELEKTMENLTIFLKKSLNG